MRGDRRAALAGTDHQDLRGVRVLIEPQRRKDGEVLGGVEPHLGVPDPDGGVTELETVHDPLPIPQGVLEVVERRRFGEIIDRLGEVLRIDRVQPERPRLERDLVAVAGGELDLALLIADAHRCGERIDGQVQVAAGLALEMGPDLADHVEGIDVDQVLARGEPRHPRRVAGDAGAADTDLPVRVLDGGDNPATVEGAGILDPQRRPPLADGECVPLGQGAVEAARSGQGPCRLRTHQRHSPVQHPPGGELLQQHPGTHTAVS